MTPSSTTSLSTRTSTRRWTGSSSGWGVGGRCSSRAAAAAACRGARRARDPSRYLVQVGLAPPGGEPLTGSHWDAERDRVRLHIDWEDEEIDLERGRVRQRSRIEVMSGPRAGDVLEELHDITAWTPATWREAIAASPFKEAASNDGGEDAWPEVDRDATGGLLWHDLRVR